MSLGVECPSETIALTDDRVLIVRVGDVSYDTNACQEIGARILPELNENSWLVIDMSGVEFIDTVGLSQIRNFVSVIQAGRMAIGNTSRPVGRILEKLPSKYRPPIYETLPEAVDHVVGGSTTWELTKYSELQIDEDDEEEDDNGAKRLSFGMLLNPLSLVRAIMNWGHEEYHKHDEMSAESALDEYRSQKRAARQGSGDSSEDEDTADSEDEAFDDEDTFDEEESDEYEEESRGWLALLNPINWFLLPIRKISSVFASTQLDEDDDWDEDDADEEHLDDDERINGEAV